VALPSRTRLRTLDYTLDGEPFVAIAARDNIDTLDLSYALDGEPFVAASTTGALAEGPSSGWGETVYFRPWCTTGRSPS